MALTLINNVNGVDVPFTAEEIEKYNKQKLAWDSEAPAREMTAIRKHRDRLLAETDWRALPDVTMSDEWKTYRQELRDIPASNTVYKDVTWPTKPE